MTLGTRLAALRRDAGLSQEAIGAAPFISTPGWIKIEHGQRQASEKLLHAFVDWLVSERHLAAKKRGPLLEELLTLKYLGSAKPFVRLLARTHAESTPWGLQLLATFDAAAKQPALAGRPGRPTGTGAGKGSKR